MASMTLAMICPILPNPLNRTRDRAERPPARDDVIDDDGHEPAVNAIRIRLRELHERVEQAKLPSIGRRIPRQAREKVVQRQLTRIAPERRVDDRALEHVVREIEEERHRTVDALDGPIRGEGLRQGLDIAAETVAKRLALDVARREHRWRARAEEGVRVGRQAVREGLHDPGPRRRVAGAARLPPGLEEGGEREAEPGVVHAVVIAHGADVAVVRGLDPEAQMAAETG